MLRLDFTKAHPLRLVSTRDPHSQQELDNACCRLVGLCCEAGDQLTFKFPTWRWEAPYTQQVQRERWGATFSPLLSKSVL